VNGGKRDTASPNQTPTPSDRKLAADVYLSNSGVTVKNTDSIDFPALTLKLNLTQGGMTTDALM